jgi:NAD-dependent deacetylase
MTPEETDNLLDTVADLCRSAQRILFITGAGISADSGLPTYRGIGGLYNGNGTDEGYAIEDALSGDMLHARPEITWKYIAQIEATCRDARPNAAHATIAWFAERAEVTVLTQNIDGLHRDAGTTDPIEIHGTLHRLCCTRCDWRDEVADYAALPIPPRCPVCGGLVRPEVVLFGEALPPLAVQRLVREMETGFDLVFSIGTTSVFPYIAAPVAEALRGGVPTVEINPGESQISHYVNYRVRLGAAAALAGIRARLEA